jgi:7 transmembrane sweet-taste receptor of 3 GCPR
LNFLIPVCFRHHEDCSHGRQKLLPAAHITIQRRIHNTMRLLQNEESLNQLGSLRYFGFTLAAISTITAAYFTIWVYQNKNVRVVKALQPEFLMTVSGGMLIMGLSIIPLSIDDQFASQNGCNIACNAYLWLVVLGFNIALSAVFTKLQRIIMVFECSRNFRRISLRPLDVMRPFAIIVGISFSTLLTLQIVGPYTWERIDSTEEGSTTPSSYGFCVSSNELVELIALCIFVFLDLTVMIMSGCKAWKARKISSEYAESTRIGIALFGMAHVYVLGYSAIWLLPEDDSFAIYFMDVLFIFLQIMDMLLVMFVPLVLVIRNPLPESENGGRGGTTIYGLENPSAGTNPLGSAASFPLPSGEARVSTGDTTTRLEGNPPASLDSS